MHNKGGGEFFVLVNFNVSATSTAEKHTLSRQHISPSIQIHDRMCAYYTELVRGMFKFCLNNFNYLFQIELQPFDRKHDLIL